MKTEREECIDVTDIKTKEARSYNMSQIKSKNTKPEKLVCKYLFGKGFRYRKNDKRFPGTPDLVLPKYKTVIFINGCFWHAHSGCKHFVWPRSNVQFWKNKIQNNIDRDEKNYCTLRNLGWNVIIVWECELKSKDKEERLNRLCEEIKYCELV